MTLAKIVARSTRPVVRVTTDPLGARVVRVSRLGARGPSGTNHPAQMSFGIEGQPFAAPNNTFVRYRCVEDMSLDAASSAGTAGTAPAVDYTLSIIRHSDSAVMATLTWLAGQTEAVVAVLIPGLQAGQVYKFVGEAVADATFADIAVTLTAIRSEN